MAYQYNIFGVTTLLQNFLMANLAGQGEATLSVPTSYAIDQYPFESVPLPLTIIDVAHVTLGRDAGPNKIMFSLTAEVHHVRTRSTDNEEQIGLTRMINAALGMEADYRFASVPGAVVNIEEVTPSGIMIGGTSRIQMSLQQNEQNVSVAVVSMPVTITWTEGKY